MCIIVWAQPGAAIPDEKILKRCWDKNYMGAGYAYYMPEIEQWQVNKGLMSWKGFKRALKAEGLTDDQNVIIHFRIGTSGNRRGPDCTHPFKVCEDAEEMRSTRYMAKNIVFHNGVVGPGEGTISDSMLAVRDYVDPLLKYALQGDAKIWNLMDELLECHKNRWLVVDGDTVYPMGKWIKDGELMWSNDGYLPPKPKPVGRTNGFGLHVPALDYTVPSKDSKTHSLVYEDYFTNGKWDWDKWNLAHKKQQTDNQYLLPEPDHDGDIKEVADAKDNDGIEYIYNEAGDVVGLADENGDILLDDSMIEEVECVDILLCPQCYHTEYLKESPLNVGDTMCEYCGAIFEKATGDIIMNDPEVHGAYINMNCEEDKEVNNG